MKIDYSDNLPSGSIVNKKYYLEILRYLLRAIRRQCPNLWTNNEYQFRQDNGPVHTSLLVREFFAKKEHHNDALVLASHCLMCFFRISQGEENLERKIFPKIGKIKELNTFFKILVQKAFEYWKKYWHK